MADVMSRQRERHATVAVAVHDIDDDENDLAAVQPLREPLPDARWHDELFLSRASILLTESLDETTICDHAIHLPLPYLADWCALHLVTTDTDSGAAPLTLCAHADPDQEPRVRALWQRSVQVTPHAIPSFTGVLRGDKRPAQLRRVDAAVDPATGEVPSTAAAHLLARVGLATAIYVPLTLESRTIGILTFASTSPTAYGPRQVALALAYASRVASVLDRAQQYRQSVEMLRARDVALVEVAHDLKAPAAHIARYAAELHRKMTQHQTPQHDTQALRDSRQIETTAHSLLQVLDDLMAQSSGELGTAADREDRNDREGEETDLIALVGQTVERYRPLAADHRLRFDFEAGSRDQVVGTWSPGALTRILDNLLSNAITFSRPEDTITLRVWSAEARAEPGTRKRVWAYLQVRDQGVGISSHDLPHVFEPFYRGSNAKKGSRVSGIGLASVRSLVRRLGGRVRIASELGEGTCLTIMLPVNPPSRSAQSSIHARRHEGEPRRAKRVTCETL